MSFLADACAIIAFHGHAGQTMSSAGKLAMIQGDIFVSAITVWEITRKVTLGKLDRPAPPGFNGSLTQWLRQAGYRALPLTWDAAERATALPPHHKDPMDRMLIATALDRGLTIISDNTVFPAYGVTTLW